jgi:hypothetical protein
MRQPLDTIPRPAVDAVDIDIPRSAADTATVPRGGLEDVEKLLTSITSGSGLAFGQATSRSSWISLGLTADVRDQGLAQLRLGELVT